MGSAGGAVAEMGFRGLRVWMGLGSRGLGPRDMESMPLKTGRSLCSAPLKVSYHFGGSVYGLGLQDMHRASF